MRLLGILLLLCIIIPILEIVILIKIGAAIGVLEMFLLLVVIGTIGAQLAKRQGLQTLVKIRDSFREKRMPADELVDGLIILIAAAVLILPGFITDVIGILLLIPVVRKLFRRWLYNKLRTGVASGALRFEARGSIQVRRPASAKSIDQNRSDSAVIDVESREIKKDEPRMNTNERELS